MKGLFFQPLVWCFIRRLPQALLNLLCFIHEQRKFARLKRCCFFQETWCAARFVHSHACYSHGSRKHVNHSSTLAAIMIIIIIIKHHRTSTINHLELLQVTDIRIFFHSLVLLQWRHSWRNGGAKHLPAVFLIVYASIGGLVSRKQYLYSSSSSNTKCNRTGHSWYPGDFVAEMLL